MTRTNILNGLNLLSKYYNEGNEYTVGAEHDVIYAYSTDVPLSEEDWYKLTGFGWTQQDVNSDKFEDYSPEDGWSADV